MLAALLIACAQVEGVGYWLLGAAALFYAGPSFLANQIYPIEASRPAPPAPPS